MGRRRRMRPLSDRRARRCGPAASPTTIAPMPSPGAQKVLSAAREELARPCDFGKFLAGLSPKDRVNAEKRVGVLEAGPDPQRAVLWRRLAWGLLALAGPDAHIYVIRSSNDPLRVESLDGNSLDPAAHFKDLTGWNRKAL